ncbi:MAG: hypothetical protein ACREF4_04750 [Gammaproteobacteria bacterium]
MLKVLLTVDTEVWPWSPGWPHAALPAGKDCSRELACYLWGGEGARRYGIPYQLDILEQFGLKGTFFVEPLFSYALGLEPLRLLVSTIVSRGQEIGLHLHPEWLNDARARGLPPFKGPSLWHYGDAEQDTLVRMGLERLREAGSSDVRAFRAGSFAAALSTPAVLARNGLVFDSSLNACYAESFPGLQSKDTMLQPVALDGIWEVPVTHFVDRPPTGRRPLQVCACSLGEFRTVLDRAADAGWSVAVIVSHSFEFVRVDRGRAGRPATPQRLLARRFEALCGHLASRRSRYETCHFSDLDSPAALARVDATPIRSGRVRTTLRHFEQLASRLY